MIATIDTTCPNCQARPGQPCTAPTNTGRRDVKWFHSARESAAADTAAPATAAQVFAGAILAALGDDAAVTGIACDCGDEVSMYSEITVDEIARIIEHAAHDHVTRRGLIVHRARELVSEYELGVILGLPALTEAEEKWRKDRA